MSRNGWSPSHYGQADGSYRELPQDHDEDWEMDNEQDCDYGDYEEQGAWGRPPPKYTCDICVVTVPCYDTLVKHRQGKEHIKREMDMEERRKRNGGDNQAWKESKGSSMNAAGYKMHASEREELTFLREEVQRLQAQVQANIREDHKWSTVKKVVKEAETCDRLHGQGRGRLVSADEGYVEDNSCSEAGSSSAGSRATVPFASKEEKKEAPVKREYWEDGEGDVKEEYGENTRQGGNKIRSGETEEEYKRRNRVKHEVKQEVSCTPGWGSSYRRAGPRM